MLPKVSGEFRVVADPELRFSQSGMAICTMRIVANSRKKNEAGEWVDDKVCWLRLTAFKKLAENIVETLKRGDLCFVEGRLQTEEWEDRETHEKKSSMSLVADLVGPSLAYKPARILEAQAQAASAPPADDPWGTPSSQSDEPPF